MNRETTSDSRLVISSVRQMKIEIRCPRQDCGTTYSVEQSKLRSVAKCARCGHRFAVDTSLQTATTTSEQRKARQQGNTAGLDRECPTEIGRFEIRCRLGAGGFGTVYRAYDRVLQREVALKVPHAAAIENPRSRARFIREPRAAAKLQHPNIVPVFDAGTEGRDHYIASAFIEGRTLADVIAEGKIQVREAAQIARAIADALQYAHELGIVHRDVKPSNIMITTRGEPMLMDFGLARWMDSDEKLTQDGTVMGTPAYMAPEQASQSFGLVGPPSDQYSLGIVLYELLTGSPPFTGLPDVVLYGLLRTPPVSPRSINPQIPAELDAICLKLIAKQPSERYADCGAAAEDLRRWLADEPVLVKRQTTYERFRRWCRRNPSTIVSVATIVGLLAAATLTLAGYLYVSQARQIAARARESVAADGLSARAERSLQAANPRSGNDELTPPLRALENPNSNTAAVPSFNPAGETKHSENRTKSEPKSEAASAIGETGPTTPDATPLIMSPEPDLPESNSMPAEVAAGPIAGSPREPISEFALIQRPASVEGVQSWTIETVGHRGFYWDAAFSPDSRFLAAVSRDRSIRIWNAKTWKLHKVLMSISFGLSDGCSLAWSPDGSTLAAAATNATEISVWDIDKGRQVRRLTQAEGTLALSWSPDGTCLASGSRLWNTKTDALSDPMIPGNDGMVLANAWSPDGIRLALYLPNGVEVWNVREKRRLLSLSDFVRGTSRETAQLAWSPDGKTLAVVGQQSAVHLFRDGDSKPLRSIPENSIPGRLGWTRDGKWLMIGSSPSHLFNLASGVSVALGRLKALTLAPDGSSIVGFDGAQLGRTRLNSPTTLTLLPGFADGNDLDSTFSRDGKLFAVSVSHTTNELRVASFPELGKVKGFPLRGSCAAIALEQTRPSAAVILGSEPLIQWLDLDSHQSKDIEAPGRGTSWMAWSPNGKRLAFSRAEGTVVRDIFSAAPEQRIESTGPVCWGADGNSVVIGHAVYSASGGGKLLDLSVAGNVQCSAASPDGRLIALGATAPEVFETTNGVRINSVSDVGFPLAAAWTSDSKVVYWVCSAFHRTPISVVRAEVPGGGTTIHFLYPRYPARASISAASRVAAIRSAVATAEFIGLDSGEPLGTWLLTDSNIMLSPDGHYRGPVGCERDIVYVVQTESGQETLTPGEFSKRFGWSNDPSKVVLGTRK
jgi:WD40 repeat protein/tRNA A-37 threonylcarbamoyl transferase component Bud32